MPARFGYEGAEAEHDLESDWILLVDLGIPSSFAQLWIEILAVVLELREPRVVVDAGALPVELSKRNLEVVGEESRRPLDAVAQADHRQRGCPCRGQREDPHRGGVVHAHALA